MPGTLKVIRRERPKYVDPANEDRGVIIAALPGRLIDKGIERSLDYWRIF